MAAALRNLAAAKEHIAGRPRDGSLPSGGPLHLARRRTARRASGAAGSARPISTSSAASKTPPAATFAWSRSRPNGRRRRASSRPSSSKASSPASATPKPRAAQIAAAVSAGATLSTHLGNGAHASAPAPSELHLGPTGRRPPGRQLHRRWHSILPPSFLNVALRAKGLERSILITDAVMPAGCAPGRYQLGEVDVELHADGSVRLAGGYALGRLSPDHESRHRKRHPASRSQPARRRLARHSQPRPRGTHFLPPARPHPRRTRGPGPLPLRRTHATNRNSRNLSGWPPGLQRFSRWLNQAPCARRQPPSPPPQKAPPAGMACRPPHPSPLDNFVARVPSWRVQ